MKYRIICFIGTDGSGKSTLLSETKKELEKDQEIEVKTAYFGWKPFLPSTKILSALLKKKNYQIADRMNRKEQKFSLIQEVMLGYYFIEYLSRYFFQIKLPLLKNFSKKKKQIMLIDRYFYDMYAHYRYANQSRIFPILIKLMPKPDSVIFLTVDVETAKQRKPEMDIDLLQEHYHRYHQLSNLNLIPIKTIKTDQEKQRSLQEIMDIIREAI